MTASPADNAQSAAFSLLDLIQGSVITQAIHVAARLGVNYKQIPVNTPHAPVHSYSKDGVGRSVNVTDPDGQDNFDSYVARVTVADGRLTITPNGTNAKLDFVEINVTVPMPRDERTKELLRELAKLNPEDPREELWKKV